MVLDTAANGWDFEVFWHSARALIDGHSPYDPGRGSAWVYKYPPWTAPFLTPLGLFPLGVAKIIWGVAQALCVISVGAYLLSTGISFLALGLSAGFYWFLFAYHALSGQITLLLLALSLWALPPLSSRLSVRPAWAITAFFALTLKVFSAWSLLGIAKSFRLRRNILTIVLIIFTLSVAAAFLSGRPTLTLYSEWWVSVGSGGLALGEDIVRGRRNQGIPAAVLRFAEVSAAEPWADLVTFLFLAIPLAIYWFRSSKNLTPVAAWAGWIGLGAVVHPLSWVHSFVLAFPLQTLTLDRAFRSRKRSILALAIIALALTTLISSSWMGELGIALEQVSVRSWGVLLSAVLLARLR